VLLLESRGFFLSSVLYGDLGFLSFFLFLVYVGQKCWGLCCIFGFVCLFMVFVFGEFLLNSINNTFVFFLLGSNGGCLYFCRKLIGYV
jgi:hypothetical protein